MIATDAMKPGRDAIRFCIRCGTCCEKGGPAFHTDDKHLVQDGIITSRNLYTIRKGEPVYENVKGFLFPASSDIIKIKSRSQSSACVFFDAEHRRCTIYDHRPMECRVLECWNTRAIEEIYAADRLTREDLLADMADLRRLVSDHQERCDYAVITRYLGPIGGTPPKTLPTGILEMVGYDIHLRRLLVEKGNMDPDIMDFLFGKPLAETLQRYGVRVKITD